MTILTESNHPGESCLWEPEREYAREVITLLSGQSVVAGEVLGKLTAATSATAAAVAGNTGNGTCSAVVLSDGYTAGVYKVTFIEPGSDAGDFIVESPAGVNIGAGAVGTEFDAGGLTFTISDGATDFAAGDQFTITIAAGSGKYVAYDQDGVDGREVAAAIAYDAIDASAADVTGVAYVRQSTHNANVVVWPSDIEAGEKTAAIAQLETIGIIVR